MGKVAGGLAVQLLHGFDAQRGQQLRHRDTARRVYGIDYYPKFFRPDGFRVHQRQGQNGRDMGREGSIVGKVATQLGYGGKVEGFARGQRQHLLAIAVRDELAGSVQEF